MPARDAGGRRVAGWLVAVVGMFVYLIGLIGSIVVSTTDSFRDGQGFQGDEEIAALMVLAVSPGGVLVGLGIGMVARAAGERGRRRRVVGWVVAALLLFVAPFGWVGIWGDGGQSGLIPAPILPALVCLVVAVAAARRPAPGV